MVGEKVKKLVRMLVNFIVPYDVDEPAEINVQKQIVIERIGSECEAEGIPFF